MLRRSLYFIFAVLFARCLISAQTLNSTNTVTTKDAASTTDSSRDMPATSSMRSERFDLLTLEGSYLTLQRPLLIDKAIFPQYTRELWQVQWRAGDPIDLYIIKPANIKKPPVALFLYSYPADTDRFRDDTYCKTVTKYGFAAVGFVSALTGQRYHDRPWKQWFISEFPESLVTTVHDVHMILNYLSSRNDLDMERIGIFGQGSGGTIAILAAASDSRLRAVDVLDPWGDWPVWFRQSPFIEEQQRGSYTTPDFLARIANLDPVDWVPTLHDRALRLQDTAFDPNTPEAARLRLRAALPEKSDVVHYTSLEDYKEKAAADGKILVWLSEHLSNEAQ